MISILFLIAGLYMIFKKEIKISSKKSIKGKTAQYAGLIFVAPALLSYVLRLIPEGLFSVIFAFINLALFGLAVLSILYFIFFYKQPVESK